ncbi:odorant receptor 67d-like isoform X1 [Stomoxys calcitrans]|uniref:odorant receptor 67d-like isoform X1 n=1 Tax=Stomoxys calcitrans TaxID=35570 RepID=UPI0027E22826|nr:odorant receptor 67d-like isoform X1 [Stomoxys calcitrans]
MTKEPSQRFREIVRVTRFCANLCGSDVFDPNYRINIRTVLVLGVILFSFSCCGYCIHYSITVKGDWTLVIQALCMGGGTLVQGFSHMMGFMFRPAELRVLLEETHTLYEHHEKIDSDYRLYLNRGVDLLTRLMKICAFFNTILAVGMSLVTVIYNAIYETRVLIVGIYLDAIDPETERGFLITMILQSCFIAVGGFGLYAGDMGTLTTITQIMTFKGLFCCKLRDLNEILLDEPDNKTKSLEALRDIIQFHQQYLSFIERNRSVSFWTIFVKFLTNFFGLVCTVFCILLGVWPAGYIYMAYCFTMMYVYCGVGTMIDIANDGFIEACYNGVLWYELSALERKMLHTMMIIAQNTKGLSVGPFVPLSVNTGLQMTKMIYSMTMMLFNFVSQ